MTRQIAIFFTYFGLFFCAMTTACTSQKADLVLKNGRIYTVDDNMRQVEAVAIAAGHFIAVGRNAEIESFIGENTAVVDLQGKPVVPGLSDSHYHFIGVGERAFNLNLDGTRSLSEFLQKVAERVAETPKDEWITGRGWIEEDWPSKRFPTRYDLDSVAPDHPVILTRADGHAVVVNSRALKLADIDKSTQDPQGGKIIRDESGEATGMLLDRAMSLVRKLLPSDETPEMLRRFAQKANEVALAYGLTQMHDMGVDFETVDVYKSLYANNELKIRLNVYIRGPGDDSDKLLSEGAETELFHDKLQIRGIKIVADGALGSRGAALLENYSDADNNGFLIYKDEEIYPTIKKALQSGIQMAIHAIGDRANRNILDLYERALSEVPDSERPVAEPRFRIEHAQIVHPDDIPRFKKLGVIPSMQPSHAIGDLHFAVRRLGLERMNEGYAWRKFLDQGSFIPAGSDAPVEEGNPMIEFYAAAVREDTTGFSDEGWFPEYKMTREEALQALTIWPAQAAFLEDKLGSIEVGKYADLVVLDQDLMTAPAERLFDTKVAMTMVGGEIAYENTTLVSAKP